MALSPCGVVMDDFGRESVRYGTSGQFPIACYVDDMTSFFVPWHWHEEFECILGWEGTVTVGVRGEKILLQPGDGLFINSGVLHSVDTTEMGPSLLRSIVFHPRLIGGTSDSIFWQNLVTPLVQERSVPFLKLSPGVPWQRDVIQKILASWQAATEETGDHENFVRYQLSSAFRQLVCHREDCAGRQAPGGQLYAGRIKQMLQFIESRFTEDLTLEQIAAAADVSASACLRCFRQTLGISPIQYIKQLRMEKAAQLLISTNRKIGQIGLECGYYDLSYFTRTFREEKGMSPRAFRAANRR